MLPDSGSTKDLKRHMTCLLTSLAALQDEVQEVVLKRQVRNIREYNRCKKVSEHSGKEIFFKGDIVWVRNHSGRLNKLQKQFEGPYYVHEVLGEHHSSLRLTSNGKEFIECSIEHMCHFHQVGRFCEQQVGELGNKDETPTMQELRARAKQHVVAEGQQ